MTQHYEEAAGEFRAVVERAPTNDYALFCLGRCLQQLGRHRDSLPPLAQAAGLRPDRGDYREIPRPRPRGLRALSAASALGVVAAAQRGRPPRAPARR